MISNATRATAVLIAFTAMQGCYHSRILTDTQPATEYRKETVHSLFWGLVQEDVVPDNCPSNAFQEVRVGTNFGYALISVVSLGIWVPMELEWRCAKEPAPSVPEQ